MFFLCLERKEQSLLFYNSLRVPKPRLWKSAPNLPKTFGSPERVNACDFYNFLQKQKPRFLLLHFSIINLRVPKPRLWKSAPNLPYAYGSYEKG